MKLTTTIKARMTRTTGTTTSTTTAISDRYCSYVGISGDADVEVVAEVASDELDEVGGVVEAVGIALPVLLTDWRISTKGEDVTNTLW